MKQYLLYLCMVFLTNAMFSSLLSQWSKIAGPEVVMDLVIRNGNILAASNDSIFVSLNNGESWTASKTGRFNWSLAVKDNKIYVATDSGILISEDYGIHWQTFTNGLTHTHLISIAVNDTLIFVTTMYGELFVANESEKIWRPQNVGTAGWISRIISLADTMLFCVKTDSVFLSNDHGNNWRTINNGLTDYNINSFAMNGPNLFAASGSKGIFRSSNDGANWTSVNDGLPTDISGLYIHTKSIIADDTTLFTAIDRTIFFSTNNGLNWKTASSGLTINSTIQIIGLGNSNIYAGTYGDGIWCCTLSNITSVKEPEQVFPISVQLDQNYPNPFNPVTTISFSIPSRSFVTLKVFDLIGREVAIIASEEMPAGSYTKQWNALNMSSGIYFYHLQAGLFTETKKLVLLR